MTVKSIVGKINSKLLYVLIILFIPIIIGVIHTIIVILYDVMNIFLYIMIDYKLHVLNPIEVLENYVKINISYLHIIFVEPLYIMADILRQGKTTYHTLAMIAFIAPILLYEVSCLKKLNLNNIRYIILSGFAMINLAPIPYTMLVYKISKPNETYGTIHTFTEIVLFFIIIQFISCYAVSKYYNESKYILEYSIFSLMSVSFFDVLVSISYIYFIYIVFIKHEVFNLYMYKTALVSVTDLFLFSFCLGAIFLLTFNIYLIIGGPTMENQTETEQGIERVKNDA